MLSFPFPFLAESSGPLIFLVKCSSLVVSSIPSKKSLRSGSSEFIQKKVFQGPKLANKFLTIHSLLRVNLTFFSIFFWVSLGQTKSIFFKKKEFICVSCTVAGPSNVPHSRHLDENPVMNKQIIFRLFSNFFFQIFLKRKVSKLSNETKNGLIHLFDSLSCAPSPCFCALPTFPQPTGSPISSIRLKQLTAACVLPLPKQVMYSSSP